ncbi:MAG: DUF4345 domain-containing protein [Novosphingobium sp.]|uniref:DUF4345 domain-containing protein n=1 Tax=Novosphingobium sp. TaxID=1874826 RepID=UPI001DE3403F|nr:DUF4345 domain-containing protein [Novosphingobium sp.]MCB2058604.1 DUF4345 domain-containing protein [Novosphingobium sp.]MCP5385315.1 DUF4345 domain-containing protein [Novosphingobium sp.]
MSQRYLAWFLTTFGMVCAAIALVHIAFGPASIPGSVPVNATMDSEDRFYATLLLGFGLAHVWAARDLANRSGLVLAMQATFFVGGVARIVSILAVGMPIPLFVFLGGLELIIPPLVWWWLRRGPV